MVLFSLMRDFRSDCFGLLMRLQFEQYLHGSFHERNIVMQPGPLTKPPLARPLQTPSFRVIDFGRTLYWPAWVRSRLRGAGKSNKEEEEEAMYDLHVDLNPYWHEFEGKMGVEFRLHAKKELLFDDIEKI